MRVRCTEECFIRGVLHQSGDEFDWPGQPEDYMIPLEPDPVPVPEPVPKEDPEQEAEEIKEDPEQEAEEIDDEPENDEAQQAQQEEPAKASKQGRRRKADSVTE